MECIGGTGGGGVYPWYILGVYWWCRLCIEGVLVVGGVLYISGVGGVT